MRLIKIPVESVGWSEDVIIRTKTGTMFLNKMSIKSIESEKCLAWYYHDVYKKLSYVYWDAESGSETPRFYLHDAALYNRTKLKKLSQSESYLKQRFAFFNYGELQRLLGIPVTDEGMSGLFQRKAAI